MTESVSIVLNSQKDSMVVISDRKKVKDSSGMRHDNQIVDIERAAQYKDSTLQTLPFVHFVNQFCCNHFGVRLTK